MPSSSTREVAYWLSIGMFTFDLGNSKGQSQGHANFYCEYLANGDRWGKYCYCNYIRSRLLSFYVYLHSTLVYSKDQNQCHAN